MSYYYFNTSKIIDRATERNKTQKYVRLFFKVPMRTVHYYKDKTIYGHFTKARIEWELKESYEDYVKSPTFSLKDDNYQKHLLRPEDKEVLFTDDEKNFHKFCEDNHLEFDIFPTGSNYEKENYFYNNMHKVRSRGEVVMLNFFNALASEYDDVLFSDNEIYCSWNSNFENLQFEFLLYIPEWGEKTPTEIQKLLAAEFDKYNLFKILEDLYRCPLPAIEITIKNAAVRKTTIAKCDFSKPLKDQYGVDIEKDDVVIYPHGGDHNFYGCKFGTVVEWGDSMVVLKSGTKRRHDKMVVVSSSNKNKKLGWELDGKKDD